MVAMATMAMAMAMAAPTCSVAMPVAPPSSSGPCHRVNLQLPRLQVGSVRFLPEARSRFFIRATAAAEAEAVEEEATPTPVEATESPPLPLPQQKIRVKLRAYFAEYIEEATKMIVEAAKNTGASIMGPVPLPTNRRVYCVLRSPHVNKNSMEHFEIRTHKRLIDIKNPNPRTIDALMQLDIPAGVDVEVKL